MVEQWTALHSVVHQRPIVGGFLRRQGVAGRQTGLRLLFQPGQVAMQLHVGDDLGEKGFPAGVILRPCLRAALPGQMVFPFFIVQIKGLILPDMLNQGTVPVAKILPPGIAVRLSLECKINAEVGLVIVAAASMFCVQPGKQGVGLMQRHLLAYFQMGAFGEKDRYNRLCRGVKSGLLCGLGLRDFPVNPAFHQLVHMAVLHFIAMFAKLIDKGNHLVRVVHGLGVLHDQPAFLVAHALSITLGPVDQGVGSFCGGGLRHNGLVVQKAVNPIPRLRLRLYGNSIGLFCGLLKIFQCVAGDGFSYMALRCNPGKNFVAGLRQRILHIVQLSAVDLFVVRAVHGIVKAVFAGLD